MARPSSRDSPTPRSGRPVRWQHSHRSAALVKAGINHGGKGGLSRELTRRRLSGRPLSKHRRQADRREAPFIAPAVLIDRRPAVEEPASISDW